LAAVRSFVAIDLTGPVRENLAKQISCLAAAIPPGTVRWVRPESIHLTLKFLGEVSQDGLGQIRELMELVASKRPPFDFHLRGLGCFPDNRRPRVIWVGVSEESGSLAGLQEALESGLERLGYRREGRPFSPHLTLGRVREGAGSGAARAAGECVERSPAGDYGDIRVGAIYLMRSDLRPTGAVYSRMAEIPLRGPK